MLEEGISYPLRGDSALGRIVVGGLLGLFSFFIIPGIALFGYLIRVLEYSARGIEEPPPFENWGSLIADGIKGIGVSIIYGILPFLFFLFATGLTGAVIISGGESGGVLAAFGIVGLLVSFVVFFVLYYLIPAALTNMALEGRFSAAFALGTIKDALLSLDYLIAWLLPFVLALLVNIVSLLVVIFTFGIGLLIIPFIQFYFQVSIFYMFGRAFGSVVDLGTLQDPEIEGTPAQTH